MATYQQSITALVDGLKTLFENRTCTEAQALANASSKPNTIYYTSDTHCVVVGGQIYGRGQQLSSVFRFCPSGSVPGQDPDFSDPDYIYIVPDGTSFTIYWLNPGGAWSHTTGFQFDIATSAEDISYDLTPTPDLGTGDVQSAIEALDGKVEQLSLDTMGKDDSGEYWEDKLHEVYGYSGLSNNHRIVANYAGTSASGYYIFIFPSSEGDVWKVEKAAGSGRWEGFWKGGTAYSSITAANHLQSWQQASGTFTAPAGTTLFAVVTNTANLQLTSVWKKTTRPAKTPADIQRQLIELEAGCINTSALEVGEVMPYWAAATTYHGIRLEVRKGQVLLLDLVGSATYAPLVFTDKDRIITEIHQTPVYGAFEAPNDGYAYLQKLISHDTDNYLYVMGYGGHAKDMADNRVVRGELQAQFDALYRKGVADGAGMASIAGLGYNVWDYITGAVNMAGVEYGCKLYRASQALSGACADRYKNNTSLVYFPKFDMSAVTTWGSIFNGCTKLQVVPDLNVSSPTGSYQFSGCTNLLEVGDIGSESGTISVYYMFQNCTHLRRVGSIHAKISGSTGRMFYVTSALTHIESINFSLQTTVYTNTGNQTFTSTSNLRYVVLKYLGTPSNCTALNLSLITNWGVATTAEPDARQSLIDTLITYSFDRVTAGYSACTVTLSANTKSLLTDEEIEQITAKGYTIA